MHQFFVPEDQIGEVSAVIGGADFNHLNHVLRVKPGEQIRVGDGNGNSYLCRLAEVGKKTATAEIICRENRDTELPSRLYLFQGLPKSDKMEWIIQKAVELGAYRVIPVMTKRSIVKWDKKKEQSKMERWNAIAKSAAEQSGRLIIPRVERVMATEEALSLAKTLDLCLIPYERAENMRETWKIFESFRPGMEIGFFIGPEGGFEEDEVSAARSHGCLPITLGKRILRTETAGLTALSAAMFRLELCKSEVQPEIGGADGDLF